MTIKQNLLKRSEMALESIKSVALNNGWLTSKEISELLGGSIKPLAIGVLLSKAAKLNKAGCNVCWDYFGGEKKSWFLTDGELPESNQKSRLQGFNFAVDEKRLLCESLCDAGWFFSEKAIEILGLSNKKVGGILRSLKEFGFDGYQISQKTIQKRWVHRCWLIEKDEPVKRKRSIFSQRWV